MSTYIVEFERIGRRHEFEPQTFETTDDDDLAAQILRFASRVLGSREVDVTVDLDAGKVWIGWGRFGSGTVTEVTT